MSETLYNSVTNLAAGAMLLLAVLVVWRRQLRSMLLLLACQGAALAALPIADGIAHAEPELIIVGIIVLVFRAVVLPTLLIRMVSRQVSARRESEPIIATAPSLLIAALLTVMAFAITRPVVALSSTMTGMAVPVSFALVLIGIQVMASRRRALSQTVGFLMLDNGITSAAFLLTSGVPLVVELGASLDVLLVTLILGVLARQVQAHFGDTNVGRLKELRD